MSASFSSLYAQNSESVAKSWQYRKKGKEKNKYLRKAAKQDAKVKRLNKKIARKQKAQGKLPQKVFWRRDDKVKALREKESGYIKKGRRKRHYKKQDRKTRRRMRKSLRENSRLNR